MLTSSHASVTIGKRIIAGNLRIPDSVAELVISSRAGHNIRRPVNEALSSDDRPAITHPHSATTGRLFLTLIRIATFGPHGPV